MRFLDIVKNGKGLTYKVHPIEDAATQAAGHQDYRGRSLLEAEEKIYYIFKNRGEAKIISVTRLKSTNTQLPVQLWLGA